MVMLSEFRNSLSAVVSSALCIGAIMTTTFPQQAHGSDSAVVVSSSVFSRASELGHLAVTELIQEFAEHQLARQLTFTDPTGRSFMVTIFPELNGAAVFTGPTGSFTVSRLGHEEILLDIAPSHGQRWRGKLSIDDVPESLVYPGEQGGSSLTALFSQPLPNLASAFIEFLEAEELVASGTDGKTAILGFWGCVGSILLFVAAVMMVPVACAGGPLPCAAALLAVAGAFLMMMDSCG